MFAAVAVAGLLIARPQPAVVLRRRTSGATITRSAARASVIAIAVLTLVLARDRAAQGQGVDRAWSACSSRRCCSSGRSGCRARTHRGRAGATPTSPARCTGRWIGNAWLRRPVVQAKLWLQHIVAGEPHFPDDREVDQAARPRDPCRPAAVGRADGRTRRRRVGRREVLLRHRVHRQRSHHRADLDRGGRRGRPRILRAYQPNSTPSGPGSWVRKQRAAQAAVAGVAAVAVATGRSGRTWRTSSASTVTSRSSCGPGSAPTTTWCCASCGGR